MARRQKSWEQDVIFAGDPLLAIIVEALKQTHVLVVSHRRLPCFSSNKAMATAHKYCLFQTFLIPTEKEDADAESYEVETVAPATDEQMITINDYLDSDLKEETKAWIRKHLPMNVSQATTVINKLKENT